MAAVAGALQRKKEQALGELWFQLHRLRFIQLLSDSSEARQYHREVVVPSVSKHTTGLNDLSEIQSKRSTMDHDSKSDATAKRTADDAVNVGTTDLPSKRQKLPGGETVRDSGGSEQSAPSGAGAVSAVGAVHPTHIALSLQSANSSVESTSAASDFGVRCAAALHYARAHFGSSLPLFSIGSY